MDHCSVCGASVPKGSLADHGASVHGAARPPIVVLVCALVGLAAGVLLYQAVTVVPDFFDLLDGGDLGRALAALILMVVLVIGGYGAALALIARMIWRGDRAGRVLAYAAGLPVAIACLFGSDGAGAYVIVGLVVAGVLAVLSFVPDARLWFTGPFAAGQGEPSTVVAARAMLGWSGFLSAVGALAFLIILTVDSGEILSFGAYAAGAVLLGLGFQQVATGDPQVRVRVTVGSGCVLLATLLSGETGFGTLAIAGPAIAAVTLLWLLPEGAAHFGAQPIFDLTTLGSSLGMPSSSGPSSFSQPSHPPQPWPTYEPSGPFPAPSDLAPPSPGWHHLPAPMSPAPYDLPPPTSPAPYDLPPPTSAPLYEPATPSSTATSLFAARPPASMPTTSGPGSEAQTPAVGSPEGRAGSTQLSGNRVLLLLLASGARIVAQETGAAWLDVPGARVAVLAGDVTHIAIEADDPSRLSGVGSVLERGLRHDDPGFVLELNQVPFPEPRGLAPDTQPGWYPDPYRPDGARYWDGSAWTVREVPG